MSEESTVPAFPIQACQECGTAYGHEVYVCRECQADRLQETTTDGAGTVYARTTIRVPGSNEQGEEPFEVATIDVGTVPTVRVTARVLDNPGLEPGDEVVYVEQQDGTAYFETKA